MEKKTLEKVDKIFTTKLIIDEIYQKGSLKYIPIDFPEIVVTDKETEKAPVKQDAEPGIAVTGTKDKVDLVYTGFFYEDIRNPRYLLDFFSHFPNEYVLHMAGGGCEDIIKEYKRTLCDRLVIHGTVSAEDARALRDKADVLVNVNNTVSNQVPSKLFEYFETGKPIINICKTHECPSIAYTERYPACISIYEDEDPETAGKKAVSFIADKLGDTVSHGEVERIFFENTDKCVADRIINAL